MKRMTLIAAAIVAAAGVASQPAAAYQIATTGRTLASPRLAADVLTTIGNYSKATGGCRFIYSADMRVVPGSATARGGHAEIWTLNACAAKQRFRVTMWPSPRGGSDFAVQPLTGRLPLHAM
ncbi:hypothetical protein F1C10_10640 [Sphingomonas sp. NBWT7]|uniref:hypothetical protein n=1 Tax=Sphingomonas sp. NBWT7 TaxID=2596913 RepID=UPI00162A7EFB|nr:hypothetical protein [Sphingomonas sp. NBWT7]QNE32357.1 hypothetical protein F1C10_10640 [Sphingomonas sp. NBWT7]